jgi:hypothetical protein
MSFTYFNVRLDPAALITNLPEPPQPPSPPVTAPVIAPVPNPLTAAPAPALPAKHAGGRPKYDWWEDMWADIGRQLARGELKPTLQKEIEIAMTTWAEERGHSPTVSTIRVRAQKLAKALGLKVEN